MSRLFIFGIGKVADAVSACLDHDPTVEIAGYTCDGRYVDRASFRGKPVVPFDQMEGSFSAGDRMLVAVGYQELNRLRERKLGEAKAKGYAIFSYAGDRAQGEYELGENTFVFPGAHVEAGVELGDNVFAWDGALIGHHGVIGDHCWITGGAAIGGSARLGRNCFVGLNATIGHETTIGDFCLIGAATLVTKDLSEGQVVIRRDTEVHRLNSDELMRFTGSL